MCKIIIFISIFFLTNISILLSQDKYDEGPHKHIVAQAWQYLKNNYPQQNWDNTLLGQFMVNYNCGDDEEPWSLGFVTTGACREDREDPVYIYSWPLTTVSHFRAADGSDEQGLNNYPSAYTKANIDMYGGPLTTVTHFWAADGSDEQGLDNYPSAYTKANIYMYGGHTIFFQHYSFDEYLQMPIMGRVYSYNNLFDFFNTGNCYYHGAYDENGHYHPVYDPPINVNIPLSTSRKWSFLLLGRIAHLLTDMSVPVHAKGEPHWPITDSYEDYVDGHWLDFDASLHYHGTQQPYFGPDALIPLSNKQYPLRYIFYITNQFADRFPTDNVGGNTFIRTHTYGSDNYDTYLTPIYASIDPNLIGDNVYRSDNLVNFSIKATASLLYWFAENTNQIPTPPPVITNITSNMIGSQQYGYTLFKGQTGALYSTVQGSPVLYNWNYSVCDPNVWLYWPYNYNNNQIYTQSFQSSPHFLLRNASYSSFSYCPVDYLPTPLHLFAKLRAYNNSGEDWSPTFRINPTTNLAGGGCPYIFVLGNDTSGGKYFTENNILHHSEFSENVNQSITDVYKLNTVPKIDSNKITIQIMETENDVNYFDQIKLFAVDHPAGSKIGITESNDIVMYYTEDVSSSDYATQNFSSYNIAPYIQYGQPTPKITGLSNDFVNSHYDSTSQYSKLKSYKNRLKSKGYKGSSDSLALIGEIGSDVMVPIQPGVKDWAGSISIYTNSDTYIKPFSKRVNVSDVIIPFAQTEDIVDNIDINFNSDYAMSYFSVVPVFYEGFTKTELNLLNAVHAVNGDILSSLSEIDNEFAVMDTTAIIDLKFESIIPPDQSMVRDYVFVVNGLYTSEYGYNTNQPFRLTSNNSIKPENIAYKYRLNTNYPNPFNPKTRISYSLAKSGITKLTVYDVLGRLMNVLVNEYKSAGEYTVEFNGSHLSSGVYIYRLESNDFMDTKRMLLIK